MKYPLALSHMEFLFDSLNVRLPKAKRVFLDIQEGKKWKAVTLPADKKYLERDRDLFLFQVYTGYYYKDLLIFTKDQLQTDEEFGQIILGARDKNGNQTIIPLFKFPYAKPSWNVTSIKLMTSSYSIKKQFIEEPLYNRNLKEIAKLAGIHKGV